MADSLEKKSNELPIPALISVVLALVGVLVQQLKPLDSPRPNIPSSVSSQYINIEDVDARLWQDPFTAVVQHDAAKGTDEKCVETLRQDNKSSLHSPVSPDKKSKEATQNHCDSMHIFDALIQSIIATANSSNNKKTSITVLGVMVSGGSYVEDIESRRRTRYAILSGLAVKDYAPEEQEHIGYVKNLKFGKNEKFILEKIPFEWFQDDKNVHPPVLVLWLNDTAFAAKHQPLQMTSDFVKRIKEETNKLNSEFNVTFKFIGPNNSNTLQLMIDELDSNTRQLMIEKTNQSLSVGDMVASIQGKESKQVAIKLNEEKKRSQPVDDFLELHQLRYYNAVATGDWPGMTIPATQKEADDKYIKNIWVYAGNLGLNLLFTRTSLTDYQLATALLEELTLRGFNIVNTDNSKYPRNNKDHIVIISEWDTIYGRRGLPNAMKNKLVNMKSYCDAGEIRNNQCSWPNDIHWVHSFSYMRGLDGVIPSAEKPAEQVNTKDKDKNTRADINQERSEGQGQQDYLRRLAAHINELKQTLKNNKAGNIKAIGVLGSDAYDKLMILKALRPNFPRVLFFTTDLDTRLMHPKEFDVTRNLIVAASFNLQLAKSLQQSIPPFRDSYQTAHFFATQIAVDDANHPDGEKLKQEDINTMLGTARLFEIANNKAIAFNYSNGADNDYCRALPDCKNAHPSLAPKNGLLDFSVIVISIIALWIMPFIYLLFKYEKKNLPQLLIFVFVIGTLVLISTVRYFWGFYVSNQEMVFGTLGEPVFWREGISIWPSELIRLFAGILSCLFIADTITVIAQNNQQLTEKFDLVTSTTGNVAKLWQDHCANRQWRVFWILCCVMFWLFLINLSPDFFLPSVPYRGEASNHVNNLVLYFSVPAFITLLATVFFTTWHNARLIKKLNTLPSMWSQKALRRFGLRPWGAISEPQVTANNDLKNLRVTLEAQNNYHLNQWLDIKFIAARTKVIGQLIYYPFIILALMIFSHSKVFDNWDIPMGLVIGFLFAIALTLGSAFYLRRTAEQARKNMLDKISSMKIALSYQPNNPARVTMEKHIDFALAQIQEINEGAFQSFANAPAFQALLIPFGGVGSLMLLENIVLNGF